MAVAKRLHRLLEAFKIPDRMKAREGKWTVFRDQDELVICNDLSEHIKAALRQSEYLVVICSRRLHASQWCRQEIQYFKALHHGSTKNIIAVLIDGTPEKCIPPELYESCDGGVTRAVEPLAVNMVAPSMNRAFRILKTEYLRLAARMLGCDYDMLYRRAYRQRQRTLLTVLFIMLVVAAGSIYSAVTIYQQNQALLYEQSEFLTKQAQVLWEKGKPIESVRMLLDVLPEKGEDRSVNVNAEYVLSQQIGAYERRTFLPVGVLEHQSPVRSIHYVGNGSMILTSDSENIYFWSSTDYSLVRSYTSDELGSYRLSVYVEDLKYENISIWEGQDVWGTPYSHFSLKAGTYEIEYGPQADPAIFMYDEYNIWRLDGETADIIWHCRFDELMYYPSLELTADGLLVCVDGRYNFRGQRFVLLDPETGALTASGEELQNVASGVIPDGRTIQWETFDQTSGLVCRDASGQVIWATEIRLAGTNRSLGDFGPQVVMIDREKAENYSDFIVYWCDNYLCVLELQNGTMIMEYLFQDFITTVSSSENGCLLLTDANQKEYAININHISLPLQEQFPVCCVTNYFKTDIELIARYQGEYLTGAKDQTEVYVYCEQENPDYEEPYEKAGYILTPSGAYALMDQHEGNTYYVVDMETLKPLHSLTHITPEEASCYGFFDETRCMFSGSGTTIVYDVMADEICCVIQGDYYEVSGDGKWMYSSSSYTYSISDPEGRQYTWSIPDEQMKLAGYALSDDAQHICYGFTDLSSGVSGIALYRMTEGTTAILGTLEPERMDHFEQVLWLSDMEVAIVYDDDVIEVYDIQRRLLTRNCEFGMLLPAKRSSIHVIGSTDAVVVVCENGRICRLDLNAREITAQIDLASIGETGVSETPAEILTNPVYNVYSELVEEENLLILIAHVGTGWNDAWFLDLDAFALRCKVPRFCDYSAKTGRVLVTDLSNFYVYNGFLPYYDTDALIERAKAFLSENGSID